jgi:hypothetical protein
MVQIQAMLKDVSCPNSKPTCPVSPIKLPASLSQIAGGSEPVALAKFLTSLSTTSTPPISLGKFLDQTGTSPVTAWRWEKRGWLKTVRIAGRKYITAADLSEFNRRLEAGEFAGTIQKPRRGAKAAR